MADHKRETLQVSRESVSFTDMKTGINILGTLQFRLVMHMSRVQRPAQRRLLDHIHVLENEERSVCWLRSSRCREFPLARQAGSRQVHV
jgi:hypothetical protein